MASDPKKPVKKKTRKAGTVKRPAKVRMSAAAREREARAKNREKSGSGPKVIPYKKEKKRVKRQQRLRKIKRFFKSLLTVAILVVALLYFFDPLSGREPAPDDLAGPYKVLWVADGDTVVLDIDGTETSVRLIGIDAPESVHWDESRNIPEGRVSSDYLKKMLKGKKVYLEYDSQLLDKYDRTLAYVWMDGDGGERVMVQDRILSDGMAQTLVIRPNVRYTLRFAKLELEARRNKAGHWAGTALDGEAAL